MPSLKKGPRMPSDEHDRGSGSWGRLPSAPAGSPNVVVVMFDDLGFGQLGCYGGPVDTPHVDALAAGGLRYNRFHVTALCSPSRAALLTGRNHHRVGVGFLVDIPCEAPGYHARRPRTMGTLAQALVANGYNAWAVGKWHLTPTGSRSHSGPFEMWPLGWGFERYYGFLNGDTNQWAPEMVEDNHFVTPPRTYEEGYHLSEDLVDRLILDIRDQQQATPDKPFMAYLSFGAMHAPHHVAPEWVEPYRGRFDAGWDVIREQIFDRQRAEGIIPPSAVLTPRPPWVAPWESLDADSRRLFARMMETYAGFLTHTDAQIGRLIEFLRASGRLDNTIVIVLSDNGASAEAGTLGTFNEHRFTMAAPESVERSLEYAPDWGGPATYSHYSWGWAWAGNAPFKLWKRYSWLGGTRSPLIVHWPAAITDAGAVRSQVTHIVDIMPTVLAACGVSVPDEIDGVRQEPLDGASMVASFTDAEAPSPRQVQYFEMLGSRSIISGEWKATTDHVSTGVADEARLLVGSRDFPTDHWALFRLDDDYSEAVDVAAEHPELVAELSALWEQEADRNGVRPLKDSLRAAVSLLAPPYPANRQMTYHPDASPVRDDLMPSLSPGGRVTAVVDVPADGGEGVLWEIGDWNGGAAAIVVDGCPLVFLSNASEASRAIADAPLTEGTHEVSVEFRAEPGGAATMILGVDGTEVATSPCPYGVPHLWQHGGTALTIGYGRGFPVDASYHHPFRFTGTIHHVSFEAVAGPVRQLAELAEQALRND
jgi:arylsulfatase A-like enzyme